MYVALIATTGAALTGGLVYWTRHRRFGSAFVNSTVNPWLVRHGLVGGQRSEIGSIEHVGRRSGVERLTPVHPEATPDGFRVMVPLGTESQWAQNVLAAGRCRLLLGGRVHDLADPRLVRPGDAGALPTIVRLVTDVLGFRYLMLREVPTETAGA